MKPSVRVLLLLAALAAPASAAPSSAPAPDAKRAAESFAIGKSAYARGDFAAAGAAFEQASLYAPHPATALNASEAWELAGELVRAADLLERVLATPQLEERFQEAASEQLKRVAAKLARVEVHPPAGARVAIDGEHDDVLSSGPSKLYVLPGPHVLTARIASGETHTERVQLAAGETKTIEFAPFEEPRVETPPPPAKDEKKPRHGPPALSWISFGVGAAGAGVATAYGFKTLSARDDFDANPTALTRDDFDSARLVTNVALGVAVVAVVTGVVLWMTDR